jgi:hypothetical protein
VRRVVRVPTYREATAAEHQPFDSNTAEYGVSLLPKYEPPPYKPTLLSRLWAFAEISTLPVVIFVETIVRVIRVIVARWNWIPVGLLLFAWAIATIHEKIGSGTSPPVANAPPVRPVETPATVTSGPDRLQKPDRDEIAVLLERARTHLSAGDVAAARLVLGRAAERDVRAALDLGGTYDPTRVEACGHCQRLRRPGPSARVVSHSWRFGLCRCGFAARAA